MLACATWRESTAKQVIGKCRRCVVLASSCYESLFRALHHVCEKSTLQNIFANMRLRSQGAANSGDLMMCNDLDSRCASITQGTKFPPPIRQKILAGITCLSIGATANAALPSAELQALVDLYNASGGPAWTSITDWATTRNASPTPVCSSASGSIVCDATGAHVIAINLYNNNLIGTLPASLLNLSQLQMLQVGYNQLSGPIPAIAGLTKLEKFFAYSNQLSGSIPPLGGMSKLVEFNVASNDLTGAIPPLVNLPALQAINLGYNQLSGTIPALSGTQLPSLNYLEIDYNHFAGSIPDLSSMTALTAFYAGHNRLNGHAPTPPSPSSLVNSAVTLCPNYLAATSSNIWDAATQSTPWYAGCDTDTIFIDGLEF